VVQTKKKTNNKNKQITITMIKKISSCKKISLKNNNKNNKKMNKKMRKIRNKIMNNSKNY
jgi:hypothetical protein